MVHISLTACSQDGPSHGSTGDGVPGVLFTPQTHQAAVYGGEQTTPYSKATCRKFHYLPQGKTNIQNWFCGLAASILKNQSIFAHIPFKPTVRW